MKHWITTAFMAAGLFLAPCAAFAQEATQSPIVAKLVVERVEFDAESKEETLAPAQAAGPGDLLQYTGTYTNISKEPLSGLVVNGPIPDNTDFIENGLEISGKALFQVLVDGEPWQKLPAFKTITRPDGTKQRVPAEPADYKEIRWQLSEPLQPEKSLVAIYRVKVEE